jgi:cardiolipin synthase
MKLEARDIPNAISILRIILVVPVALLLVEKKFDWALYLFVFAAVSDGLDGFLAKRFGWTSRLGSLLDPIADKLLLVTCYVLTGWLGLIPVWLVWLVMLRDVVIVVGATAYHYLFGPFMGEPTLISKINTVAQIVLVVLVIFDRGILQIPERLIEALVSLVVITTVSRGLSYILIWWQRARCVKK